MKLLTCAIICLMDTLTREQRIKCMRQIRSKNTNPELRVRRLLFSMGLRYRLHVSKLAGKPDIVISKLKTIIFVNGCFWHQHKNCRKSSLPKSNTEYWMPKLLRNIKKQKDDIRQLRKSGWGVVTIWECETKKAELLTRKVEVLA